MHNNGALKYACTEKVDVHFMSKKKEKHEHWMSLIVRGEANDLSKSS